MLWFFPETSKSNTNFIRIISFFKYFYVVLSDCTLFSELDLFFHVTCWVHFIIWIVLFRLENLFSYLIYFIQEEYSSWNYFCLKSIQWLHQRYLTIWAHFHIIVTFLCTWINAMLFILYMSHLLIFKIYLKG